jgi:putative hydroxymethylpyrimidine transport system substrate-binding protein
VRAARALSVVLVLLAASCGGGSADTATSVRHVTLVLDWVPNPDHVGIYSAMDKGFFARYGLAVTPRPPSGVSDALTLVGAGRADVGVSYEPELFFAQEHHAPVAAVATIVPTALASIIASGSSGIHSPADLRGKTIGVDGTQSTAAFVDRVLSSAGLGSGDVHIVDVKFNQVPALLGGKVDAVAGVFQNIEGVLFGMRGLHPVVFPYDRYGVPPYDELVVVANADRLREDAGYRTMVREFVAGLAAGTGWAKAHPSAAVAVMRRHSADDYRAAPRGRLGPVRGLDVQLGPARREARRGGADRSSLDSGAAMDSLKGQLLIAAPMLVDPNFHRTVVLIMEHSEEGALGVVLNRPTELAVGDAVPDLAELADGDPVFAGGPVQPQAVIALAEHTGPVGDESVCGPIAPIQVSDDIEDISGHVARVRVFAGYAGWGEGQLDDELAEEAWFTEPALPGDIFAGDTDGLWRRVLERKGGEFTLVARMPPDPSMN